VAVVLTCPVLSAQHSHGTSQSGSPIQLKVVVDGAKAPDRIPDNLAYQHFFAAVSAHPFPSAQELGRQRAQLFALHLSEADQQNLVQALAVFRTGLDPLEAALRAQPSPAQAASLRQQKDSLLTNAMTDIRSSLTADGFGKLDQYIKTQVKQHIVIYGDTMLK
jgi:hypothetical protein